MTVGELRRLIEDLEDDMPVLVSAREYDLQNGWGTVRPVRIKGYTSSYAGSHEELDAPTHDSIEALVIT